MSIASWIFVGALVGLFAPRLRPKGFYGGTFGAIVTGAVGGFVGGGVFAALDDGRLGSLISLPRSARS